MKEFQFDHIKIVNDIDDLDKEYRELLYDYLIEIDDIAIKFNNQIPLTKIEFNKRSRLNSMLQYSSKSITAEMLELTVTCLKNENITASDVYIQPTIERPLTFSDMFVNLVIKAFDNVTMEDISKLFEFNYYKLENESKFLITITQL